MAARQFSGAIAGTDADDRGRFIVTVPSAGMWRLVANAPGYTTQAYEEHQTYASAIVLTEQAPVYDLTFRISPEASVTGTVLDEAGESVRNAQVRLLAVPPASPDGKPGAISTRSVVMTDDRGYYEFANLAPGNYRVAVNTKPWYASSAQPRRPAEGQTNNSASSLDPSLDVTYAETWYPGGDDAARAETISLHAGDTARADFSLVPVPAIHLRLITPPNDTGPQGHAAPYFPVIERVGSGGGVGGLVSNSIMSPSQGQIDIGGLSPGLYQIRLQNQNQEPRVALVQVTENGARTVDFNAPSDEANITIHFEGAANDDDSIQVGFIDAETGQRVTQFNPRPGGPMRGKQQEDRPRERIMQVPPGRYEVVLGGKPDIYLDGMKAQSAEVDGRYIKIHNGTATLTIHTARGRTSVAGAATIDGKPAIGAMVLLVPAGLDDPSSVTLLARDQTNTDGSYDLPAVIPGQYILLAIDNGWQINWKDATTLNRYLIHGVPLDLRPGTEIKQNIEAQAP
jgi:protocatechuate 3,4-dioxygenase beta subunit